jgi:hypothetical protein
MGVMMISCETDRVSDGCHTFGDMYRVRSLLFIALMRQFPAQSFRSLRHCDGSARDGQFLAGTVLPTGKQVSVHMREEFWPLLHGMPTPDLAPQWDGHGNQDALNRLEDWLEKFYRSKSYGSGNTQRKQN